MEVQKRAVNCIVTHTHLDDALAAYLGRTYGEQCFPGIGQAAFKLTNDPGKKTLAQIIADKELWIGCGQDIDEHRDGKNARLRKSSAALIMAEKVGAYRDKYVRRLVDEATHFDSSAGCPKSHVASILKMFKTTIHIGGDKLAMNWCQRVITAVHHSLARGLKPDASEISFENFVADELRILRDGEFEDKDAYLGLCDVLDQARKTDPGQPGSHLFGLKNVYESLWRYNKQVLCKTDEEMQDVKGDVSFALGRLYEDQVNFHSFRREIKALAKAKEFTGCFVINVWHPSEGLIPIRAAIAQSDNPQAHNALRSLAYRLSIVKNGRGNVTIQGDIEYASEYSLLAAMDEGIQNLTAMNRFLDMPEDARSKLDWDVLRCRGNCPGDDKWHQADIEWLGLYNGTHYHKAEPTSLSIEQLKLNARAAFNPHSVANWKLRHGVKEPSWVRAFRQEELFRPLSMRDLARAFDTALRKN